MPKAHYCEQCKAEINKSVCPTNFTELFSKEILKIRKVDAGIIGYVRRI